MFVIGMVGVGTAVVLVPRLLVLLEQWQAEKTIRTWLWLGSGGVWITTALLAVLNTGPLGVGAPAAHVLWMVPFAPATRFRALWGVVMIEGLWNWLVCIAAVLGTVLAATLRWNALPWLWVVFVGSGGAAWCGIVAGLAVRTAVGWRWLFVFAALAMLSIVLVVGSINTVVLASINFRPGWVGAVLGAVLVVLLGPLAGAAVRLYECAFLAAHQHDRTRSTVYVPGAYHFIRWLRGRRSLVGALLAKGVLNRGRSKLNLLRFAAPFLHLAFFPWIGTVAARYSLDSPTLVGIAATLLVLAVVSETVPSPIGGEGSRMALLLSAPLPHSTILWAKWTAFVVPFVGYGTVLGTVLGLWSGLASHDLLFTLIGVVLVLLNNAALWVWGSAWDVDLHAPVTGPEQAMLVEELPVTPWRILLIGGNFLFAGAAWMLVWVLPATVALPLLAAATLIVYVAAWRLGSLALRRLPR